MLGTMAAGNPAMASPDDELIWEEGTVTSVADGDTLDGDHGRRTPEYAAARCVRTIGVQAPEVATPDRVRCCPGHRTD